MTIEVKPLHPAFGAEVSGVDLTAGDALTREIEAAIGQYGLLLFRNMPFDDEALIRFGNRFGPMQNLSAKANVPSPIAMITNLAEDGKQLPKDAMMRKQNDANCLWHIDSTYLFPRATYSYLNARIVTSTGGETEYCDTRVAWDALTQDQRARIENVTCDHAIQHSRRLIGYDMSNDFHRPLPSIRRKLVEPHAPSGRNAMLIASHVEAVEGMSYEEARALIDELIAIASAPERVYTHRWAVGDLLMWDNRCVLHRGKPYAQYDEARDLRSVRNDDVNDNGVVLGEQDQANLAAVNAG
jgi:alpha-ketoglutarate-dependent 2,4-dichlorophenoxyacetate dioxygenase